MYIVFCGLSERVSAHFLSGIDIYPCFSCCLIPWWHGVTHSFGETGTSALWQRPNRLVKEISFAASSEDFPR